LDKARDDAPYEEIFVERNPVREQVRRGIVRLIISGALEPGSNITERRLSARLGVSRTPVREALLGLERDGLVYTDPNRGFFVQPLTVQEVQETYPILWTLEQLAVRLTTGFSATTLQELRRLNEEMRHPDVEPHQAIELDNRWHLALAIGCGNARLIDLLATLKRTIHRYEFAYMATEGLAKRSVEQHSEIIAAIEGGDMESASQTLEDNFRISLEFFVEQLRDGQPVSASTDTEAKNLPAPGS
jgi:DNA-binding GntR family transcriptional regulator